uniref:AlNc14C62G4518 protein n=1 Tax=Albugo laibachii Nc14 TaxID=890382 RepID=F0WCZ4_9STRA|nr:AlNc14C62G4518 [Albugo laibachii Nc14]|eukprot:CCA19065.1 AlNc14C62G4518 [Albugo laibachii Nc14]
MKSCNLSPVNVDKKCSSRKRSRQEASMYVTCQQLNAVDDDVEVWLASDIDAYKKYQQSFLKKEDKEKRRKLKGLKDSVQTLEFQLFEAETKMDELRALIQILVK